MNNIADDLAMAFNDGYEKGKSDAEAYIFHCGDPKQKTNADRIRNMDDYDLAIFLENVSCKYADTESWLDWLKRRLSDGEV